MSQDNQNRDPQNPQREDEGVDQPTREGRGADSQPNPDPSTTDDMSNVEDTDEMDEDRDEDEREDGKNRRNNIG